jgi:transcriptional antiterminator NusG
MAAGEETDTTMSPTDLLPIGTLTESSGQVEPEATETAVSDEPVADGSEPREAVVLDEDGLLEPGADEDAPRPESAYDKPGKWYVVHTQSGYENKVRQNLNARTASMNFEDRILEVVIPMEDVVEFRNGKKVTVAKKMFPGYLLVRCHLDDSTWAAIRDTPGIVNFVGAGGKPSRLSRREIDTFLPVIDATAPEAPKKTRARLGFDIGDIVRVKEGPFADFSGEIIEINVDQLKVKVLVDIFGRETPVELGFAQVAQL